MEHRSCCNHHRLAQAPQERFSILYVASLTQWIVYVLMIWVAFQGLDGPIRISG